MNINDFITRLSEFESTDTVFNMYYGDKKEAAKCRERLKNNLEKRKNAKIVLVGEAPGYNGCTKTGIPFESDGKEISSKIIKEILSSEHPDVDVLTWNAFPFHTHQKNNPNSNRKPNVGELQLGYRYLNAFLATFPEAICFGAVGKVAEQSLEKQNLYFKPIYIRHPSYGGKEKCRRNIAEAFKIFEENIQEYNSKLKKYGHWPNEITEEKNSEFLDKIKLDFIRTLECERNDPFYDSITSTWRMRLKLDVYGQRVRVYISEKSKYYKKLNDMIKDSKDFNYNSMIPKMYGYYEFKRKS